MGKQAGDWKDVPEDQSPEDQSREERLPEEPLSPEERIITAIDEALATISTKINTDGMKIADVVKEQAEVHEYPVGR